MSYAENTTVPVDRSKAEIEKVLTRYGASGFGYMTQGLKAAIMFEANGLKVRFILPLPDPNSEEFSTTPTGRRRKGSSASSAYEQEQRRRWRALALAIKAKLEAVETGITQFEEEFLAHIVLPNGQTVADSAIPAIQSAYESGQSVPLLPAFT